MGRGIKGEEEKTSILQERLIRDAEPQVTDKVSVTNERDIFDNKVTPIPVIASEALHLSVQGEAR